MRLGFVALISVALTWSYPSMAQQQPFPERPIRLLVSAAAGTGPDIIARLIGPKLAKQFRQAVIIENRPGANGSLAAGEVARAAPDGHTLLVMTAGTMTANPYLFPKSASSALQTLVPVTQIATVDFIVAVRNGLKIQTLPALIALMRNEPGKLTAATTSHGSFPHLAAEMLRQMANVNFVIVKSSGGAQAGVMTAGEHADFVIETAAVLQPFIDAGKLVALASSASKRGITTPDLPTVEESGVQGFAISGWVGLAAPSGTTLQIRQVIQIAVAEAVTDSMIHERLVALQFTPIANSPDTFNSLIARERAQFAQVIKAAKLTAD